jgi:methylase of polypeptide subunit release factors
VDLQTAQAFRRLLIDSGYRTFHMLFGDGNQRFADWEKHSGRLEDPLRGLVQLFLLRQTIDRGRARQLLGDTIMDALLADKILIERLDEVSTDVLILISFRSLFFFHEYKLSPAIYFGFDSVALGLYQNPTPGGISLDLCSGSSIQAMIAAQHSRLAYGVEINPRAANIARFNVRLNALQDRVQIINSSLEDYAEQVTEPLDLVTFNPPLLPVPPALDYPFVGDGGGDALDISRRALHAYLPHLAPGGAIEFIGCGLGANGHPTFADDLSAITADYGTRAHTHLVAHCLLKRGDLFYENLVLTTSESSQVPIDICFYVFEEHFKKIGMTDLWLFFFRGTRDEVVRPAGLTARKRVTDIANLNGIMHWFQ